MRTVAVYFVASPLHYLAARLVAKTFELEARQVLVWYRHGVQDVVDSAHWDASMYMPWPRLEPLGGWFGQQRRLQENIRMVAELVGPCDRLVIHSAVFDTEAVNYFLRALPKACGATKVLARILPDGVLNLRRRPLSPSKRVFQYFRKIRRLMAPELDYTCFGGDRIGSDAAFCDRIYVLHGWPHEYPKEKVYELPPLAAGLQQDVDIPSAGRSKKALVIGQPLLRHGLLSAADLGAVTQAIREWFAQEGITEIYYKAHPRDPDHELRHVDYRLMEINEPLETHMVTTSYDAVVSVVSTALLVARQIYPARVRIRTFGWNCIRFRAAEDEKAVRDAFLSSGIEIS